MKSIKFHQGCAILSAIYILVGLWSWMESGHESHRLTVAYMGLGLMVFYPFLLNENRIGRFLYTITLFIMAVLLFMPFWMSYQGSHYIGMFRMSLLIVLTSSELYRLFVDYKRPV